MKKLLFCCFFILNFFSVYCQSDSCHSRILAFANAYSTGKTFTDEYNSILSCQLEEITSSVQDLLLDSVSDNKEAAYRILYLLRKEKKFTGGHKKFIMLLIEGAKNPDSGIAGQCIGYLQSFPKSSYDNETILYLSNLFRSKTSHFNKLILLCGYVGTLDLIYDFRKLLDDKTYPDKKSAWALHLALARMGEADQIDYCINKVKRAGVNDDVIYELIPDLVYTRQKKAFDYLFDIIQDTELKCHSSNPDSEIPVHCGYRIIEMVAPYIRDFPFEVSTSGDLKIKKYDSALQTVREWAKSTGMYSINNDIY